MIKKFKDYINEELKSDTYYNAAKKLRELGGAHEERGKNILNWVDTSKKRKILEASKPYGEYSMNYQVVSGVYRNTNHTTGKIIEREFNDIYSNKTEYKIDKGDISSVRKSPNKCYISLISCTDFEEDYSPEDIETIIVIYINVFIIDIESGKSVHAFNYEVPIVWADESFKLWGNIRVGVGWNEDESKILFSDRVSAVKFKKMMKRDNIIKLMSCETGYVDQVTGKKENYYDDVLRKFFMEYSTAEEMEKLFKLIESVPVNSLWD